MPQTYSEKKRAGVCSRLVGIAHSPAAAYLIVSETLFRAPFGLNSSARLTADGSRRWLDVARAKAILVGASSQLQGQLTLGQ